MPLPNWLAKITLMTYSSPSRAVDMVGFIACLMMVISLAELEKIGGIKKVISLIIVAINVIIPWCYEIEMGLVGDWIKIFGCMALVTGLVQFVMIAKVNSKIKKMGVVAMSLFVLYTGLSVNPLMTGISTITSKPIAIEISNIVEKDKDAKWIATDSRVTQNFLVACGASTYNSVHYFPNMEMWKKIDPENKYEEIYNRYAHVVVSMTEEKTSMELLNADCVRLNLSYEDLAVLDVSYIYSEKRIEEATLHKLKLVVEQEGAYIYQVNK